VPLLGEQARQDHVGIDSTKVSISHGMPIPHGIDDWRLDFDFDRVFWFVCLENRFVEIRPAMLGWHSPINLSA